MWWMIAAAGDLPRLWKWHSILIIFCFCFWRFWYWEWLCGFWHWHWWFVTVGSLVRNSNKQPHCLCNAICNSSWGMFTTTKWCLFTIWSQWNKLRCLCHIEDLKKGPTKKKEKAMRHESTLLREWTWSPMYNLASGNTVCGHGLQQTTLHLAKLFVSLFLLFSSHTQVPRFCCQNHVLSLHPRSQSNINLLQEK